jgi:hypothetical protein
MNSQLLLLVNPMRMSYKEAGHKQLLGSRLSADMIQSLYMYIKDSFLKI